MNIRFLESVLAVHRYRSFQEAGSFLALSVSSVSKHVAAVEEELKTEIFVRGTKARSVTLSEAGARLMPLIEETVDKYRALEHAAEQLYNDRSSRLNVAYHSLIGSMGEESIIAAFCVQHPQVELSQQLLSSVNMLRMLKTHLLDGAFLLVEEEPGVELRKSERFRELFESGGFGAICYFASNDMYVGISEQNPLSSRESLSLEELRGETFIFNQIHEAQRLSRTGQGVFQRHEPPLQLRFMDFTRRKIVFDTVAAGGGVVPTVCCTKELYPGLRWVSLRDWNVTTRGVFIYRRDVRTRAMQSLRRLTEDFARSQGVDFQI